METERMHRTSTGLLNQRIPKSLGWMEQSDRTWSSSMLVRRLSHRFHSAMPLPRSLAQWCWTIAVVSTLVIPRLPAQQRLLGPKDVDTIASKPADTRLAYEAGPEQFGELRVPTGSGPFPLAIVLHGGCFRANLGTVQSTAALSDALRDAGVATWNVEYRRTDNPGGGWPGTFMDVAAAAYYVRLLAAKYRIDTTRVIAVGHSAGGFLAAWLAARS